MFLFVGFFYFGFGIVSGLLVDCFGLWCFVVVGMLLIGVGFVVVGVVCMLL